MAGIVGFGTYVPRYRLPREVIAKEWGQPSMGGEKAVAGHDEDSLTLAVNAALHALPDGAGAGHRRGLLRLDHAARTARSRAPRRSPPCSTPVPAVRTADVTDSLRAGTSALLAALDAVHAGATCALVCAGDCRMGEPDSPAEQNYGDAGAALLLGARRRR